MPLPKRYNPSQNEPKIADLWQQAGTYHFQEESPLPVYSLDTPPATVSGNLHLGHVYSYSHPDFIARYFRMNGYNVFYPMGFDDNGLPTGRLVEGLLKKRASQLGRKKFSEHCLQLSEQYGNEYKTIWQHLGLSIDWRYSYRTISPEAQKISQYAFLELLDEGRAYRKEAPSIWCPECETAIAQAEMEDAIKESEFVHIKFPLTSSKSHLTSGDPSIKIATTRPELLPACVAIFVHPQDERYKPFVASEVEVPIFNQRVPIMEDELADPEIGTGAVMCCTFGDQTDVTWWHKHNLPLVEAIDRSGRLTAVAGRFEGLSLDDARIAIKKALLESNALTTRYPLAHAVRVHERCSKPVEYISTAQWFIRVLDLKELLLAAGRQLNWVPSHMQIRYENWVQNLDWDWCISRQRYYGVPIPVWYCQKCHATIVPDHDQLPIDPLQAFPRHTCLQCGSSKYNPETDVMDTWATSSLSPQIAARWLSDDQLHQKIFPYALRPQAHEIIRTWTFYTILRSKLHFNELPWENALISGWGIAAEGTGKISKSRGGGPVPPMKMFQDYSADAVRYWSASTSPGKDAVISEEKIKTGAKLVNKLWNVARFSAPFINGDNPPGPPNELTTGDKWSLSKLQKLIKQVTHFFAIYDYAAAKAETEAYFWIFADNYIEMSKQRLYDPSLESTGAIFTLRHNLLTLIKLFAPILPFITERIYQGLFIENPGQELNAIVDSIHTTSWPQPNENLIDDKAEMVGDLLVHLSGQVRKYKSERSLPLNTPLKRLKLVLVDQTLCKPLRAGIPDLRSTTRAERIELTEQPNDSLLSIYQDKNLQVLIEPR